MVANVGNVLGASGHPSDQDASLILYDANDLKWEIQANSDTGNLDFYRADTLVFTVSEVSDRLDFTGFNPVTGNTDGGLIKAGTSGTPIVEDTANYKFLSFYFDNGATSGDSRGMYLRQYITGAGGGGEAARIYSTVLNVAAATVRGAHISLDFGASGTVTGLGAAVGATLHIPDDATQAGTLAVINAEIWSDGSTSDPAGAASLSCFRVVNAGNSTGMADVDDDAVWMDFSGWTVGDGNMIAVKSAGSAPNVVNSIRIRLPNGSLAYIMASASPLTA